MESTQNTTCNIYGSYYTITHMKTTIDIANNLLIEAKQTASSENRTLREIVESSLRKYLDEKKTKSDFEFKNRSFNGLGLVPGASLDWTDLSEKIY